MRAARALALAFALPLAFGLAGAAPRIARAEPTAQQWSEWKGLMESGRKARSAGRAAEAVDFFTRADAIHKSPTLDLELGQALAAAGKLVEAKALLGRLAETTDPSVLVKRARDAAKKSLAEIGPRVPTLRVTVNGAAGASVTLDGASIGAGSDVPVNPGEHTLRISAEGFKAAERTVRVAEGGREAVTLELAPAADSSAVVAKESTSGSRAPGFALLGVGGAGLVVGGVFGGLAFAAAGSAKAACTGQLCPPSAADDISRSKTFGNVSTGAFIGGGVVAAVGIVLAIVAPGGKPDGPPKEGAALGLTPLVGPGTVGVAGRF